MSTLLEDKLLLVKKPVTIKPLNMAVASVRIVGTAPYLQNRFSSENRDAMAAKQREGSLQSGKRRGKAPKDFERVYRASMHVSTDGWYGIPATALRHAMIEACKLAEFVMKDAKKCVFIEADGLDRENLEPLVRIEG